MKANDFLLCTFNGDTNNPKITYVALITDVDSIKETFKCHLVDTLQRFEFKYSFTSSDSWEGKDLDDATNVYHIDTHYIYTAGLTSPLPDEVAIITFADSKSYLCYIETVDENTKLIMYNYPYYRFCISNESVITESDWETYPTGDIVLSIGGAALSETASKADTKEQTLDAIIECAKNSTIAKYKWKDRGMAPVGYTKGMALMFARSYCRLKNNEPYAIEMSKANTNDETKDGLAWYSKEFSEVEMDNSKNGVDTLRHLYVMLFSLGMRETSGKYCEGYYAPDNNTTADTAEAGLFQYSYNLRSAHSLLPLLFDEYSGKTDYLEVFKEGNNGIVTCKASDAKNFGSGKGMDFQKLSKTCPAFAVEYAAIGVRNRRRHWAPLRDNKTIELKTECDDMFLEVQKLVDDYFIQSPIVL